jgi:hypothetical protein
LKGFGVNRFLVARHRARRHDEAPEKATARVASGAANRVGARVAGKLRWPAEVGAHGPAFDRRCDLNIVALALRDRLGVGVATVSQDLSSSTSRTRIVAIDIGCSSWLSFASLATS